LLSKQHLAKRAEVSRRANGTSLTQRQKSFALARKKEFPEVQTSQKRKEGKKVKRKKHKH